MVNARPSVLLTRPAKQSGRFAADFAGRFGRDWKVVISPLMAVQPCPLVVDPARFTGLIFTSENGVEAFAAQVAGREWPVWCVGPRTAVVARRAGFTVWQAGGDAASLVKAMQGKGGLWLHLRGEHTAGAIAQSLNLAGTETCEAVIYRQNAMSITDEGRGLLMADKPVLVPLYSPRSAELFAAEAVGAVAPLWIAAISQAVAERLIFAVDQLAIAERPESGAMLDAMALLIGKGHLS